MVKKCQLCGGPVARQEVTHESHWSGALALVENVPALVCQQCGERYYEASVAEALADLREDPPEAVKTVALPVYTYAQAQAKAAERHASGQSRTRRAS